MLTEGIRSTDAHAKKHHPLDQAHTPVAAPSGRRVYVVCGWQGCPQRLEVDAAVWHAEVLRRRQAEVTYPMAQARGFQEPSGLPALHRADPGTTRPGCYSPVYLRRRPQYPRSNIRR